MGNLAHPGPTPHDLGWTPGLLMRALQAAVEMLGTVLDVSILGRASEDPAKGS